MFALAKNGNKKPVDGKTEIGYWFWNVVNRVVVFTCFDRLEIVGQENIPPGSPFLLVSNHSSRWDGLLVQHILNRRANYMVSPNEMKGLQGSAVMSVGAFPANPRLDLVGFAHSQLKRGEPVVIFPEGNIFQDGKLHPFKKGVARIAMAAVQDGLNVPVVPMSINYWRANGSLCATILIGEPIKLHDFQQQYQEEPRSTMSALAEKLFNEVHKLKSAFCLSAA